MNGIVDALEGSLALSRATTLAIGGVLCARLGVEVWAWVFSLTSLLNFCVWLASEVRESRRM